MRSRGRRSGRIVDSASRERLLESLGQSRNLLTSAMAQLPVRGPEYLAAEAIVSAIDGMAEHLTGSRQHFWARPVTTSGHGS